MQANLDSRLFASLANQLDGELHLGDLVRSIYATDASAYQQMAERPSQFRTRNQILVELIRFCW